MSTTQKSIFHRLQDPHPSAIKIWKPCYHRWKGKNCILMFMDATHSEKVPNGIMVYDLDNQRPTNNIIGWYPIPRIVELETLLSIDRENDIIYMTGPGIGYEFIAINMNKHKQWFKCQDDELENDASIESFTSYFIPSPINEFHLTCHSHFKFDEAENRMVKLNNDTSLLNNEQSRLVYCKNKKQLIMFQSLCDYILYCDISESDGKVSDWKKYETAYPYDVGGGRALYGFDVILAWDQIIFWLDNWKWTQDENGKHIREWKIWCLDLEHNQRWYQAQHELPDFEFTYVDYAPHVIKDDDNNIHLISFWEDNNRHFKASLSDLVPMEIIRLNQDNKERFDPLIIGYVKEFEKRNKPMFIPLYLKKIILKYYPIFL